MVTYGIVGDLVDDDYMRMSESTYLEPMYMFYIAFVAMFCGEYLREPNAPDTTRFLSINASRGFPEMVGSIARLHALGVK
jgi:hypothetical protein